METTNTNAKGNEMTNEELDAVFENLGRVDMAIREADAEIQAKLDVATMLEECGIKIEY